jgi:hypothetical protein
MRTVYPTTRAGYFDTRKIAEDKWLQQLQNPTAAAAGTLAEPTTTENEFRDTKLITLQKILTSLQGTTTPVTPPSIGTDGPMFFLFLQGWLRADSFVALADGSQVGDVATQWLDQSENGRNGNGVGLPAQPSYETNEVNGLPVVRFDTQQEQLNFIEVSFSGDFTVTLCGRTTVGADTLWLGHDSTNHQCRRNRISVDNASFYAGGSEIVSSAFAAPSSAFQVTTWRRESGTVSFRQNKTARGTGGPDNNVAKFNTLCNNLFLASGLGDIGEIAYWSQALPDASIDALYDGWFKPRWALP